MRGTATVCLSDSRVLTVVENLLSHSDTYSRALATERGFCKGHYVTVKCDLPPSANLVGFSFNFGIEEQSQMIGRKKISLGKSERSTAPV